jgi:hypothetical protein
MEAQCLSSCYQLYRHEKYRKPTACHCVCNDHVCGLHATTTAATAQPTHYMVAASPSVGTFSVTGTSVSAGGATGAKVSITGEGASGESFTIHINPYAGTTGTLTIGGETGVLCKTASGTWINSTSGSITLTATSPDIIGTFGYLGSDGNTFTGSFNVPAP